MVRIVVVFLLFQWASVGMASAGTQDVQVLVLAEKYHELELVKQGLQADLQKLEVEKQKMIKQGASSEALDQLEAEQRHKRKRLAQKTLDKINAI